MRKSTDLPTCPTLTCKASQGAATETYLHGTISRAGWGLPNFMYLVFHKRDMEPSIPGSPPPPPSSIFKGGEGVEPHQGPLRNLPWRLDVRRTWKHTWQTKGATTKWRCPKPQYEKKTTPSLVTCWSLSRRTANKKEHEKGRKEKHGPEIVQATILDAA